MARTCTICTNKNRHEINKAIVQGHSYRDIANQYSVSKASIQRHAKNHLPLHLVKSEKAKELKDANDIIASIFCLELSAKRIQEKAEEKNDFKSALLAIRESARLLQMRGTLLGHIESNHPNQGGQTTINRINKVDIKALLVDSESRKALDLLASKHKKEKNE